MVLAVLAAGMALASCGQAPQRPARSAAAPQRPATTVAPAPRNGGAAVWNLRAGLNVAALSCRRTPGVQRDYRKLLSRHKDLLAATYEAERRRGGSGFDRQQTRLYNRFANQRSPARFCQTAAGVAKEASAMESARLVPAASGLVARLERGLR